MFAALIVAGCDCGEEPGGNNVGDSGGGGSGGGDSGGGANDGAAEGDGGAIGDTGLSNSDGSAGDDSGTANNDGSTSNNDGGPSNDGGSSSGDGGDPLAQSLEDFCMGSGAVIAPGGDDPNDCSGNLAMNTFQYAICTCEGITLQSNLTCDAFDSRLGPYGANTPMGPNILEDGHIGVDGALSADGMVNVLGSVFVAGGGFEVGQQSSISLNVYAAGDANQPNSSTSIGRNMFINGNVSGRYDIAQDLYVPPMSMVSQSTLDHVGGAVIFGAIPSVTPCPCGPGQIVDVQAYVDYGRAHNDNVTLGVLTSTTWATGTGPDTITLPCGRYYLTRVDHPRGLTIRAQDRTVLFVDGDVTLGGGLRIELDPGAELDFFIAGSLTLQAASRLGDEDHPSAVRTYIGGSMPIILSANSLFGGNLYAPSADVMFNASTDLFGALFCKNAIFGGSANVHFDDSIRAAGENCDAGTEGDASTSPDTGVPTPDSGVPASDAGVSDSGVPDSGGCTTDLDCPPFEICDTTTGMCKPTI